MGSRSFLVEGQRDLAEPDAELAHHRLVEHHALVHQVHPVVELHFIDAAVHRQLQRVAPVQGIAGSAALGRADDVKGEASGTAYGNALQWRYTLLLPVDGKTYEVQFDDWMYLMNDEVMLNKSEMRKFGFKLGEVVIAFKKGS